MNLHRRHHFITNYRFRLSSLPSGGAHALLDSATAAGVPSKCDDDHGDFVGCGGKGVNRRPNACNVEESHLVLVGWTGRPIGQTDVKAEPCMQYRFIINSKTVSHSLFDAHLEERERSSLPDDFEIAGICLHWEKASPRHWLTCNRWPQQGVNGWMVGRTIRLMAIRLCSFGGIQSSVMDHKFVPRVYYGPLLASGEERC